MVIEIPQGDLQPAADLYASELCDMISELANTNKLPKIVVSSLCLGLVLAAVLKK